MQKLSIELELLLKDAVSNLKDFSATTKSQLTSVNDEITKTGKSISSAFNFAGGIAAVYALYHATKEVVSAGLEAQGAIDKLSGTLKFLGDETPVSKFEELASEIQNLTGVSDEAVLSQISLLKNLGATGDQVDLIIRTASELSTVFDQDLGSSVNELVQTFSGTIPRALSRTIPELKNLTKEQLIAGDAVKILNDRLNGISEQIRGSTSVQVKILKQSLADSVEEIGKTIINTELFRTAILKTTEAVKFLNEVIKDAPKLQNKFLLEFTKLDQKASSFVNNVPVLREFFQAIGASGSGLSARVKEFENVNKELTKAPENLKKTKENARGLGFELQEVNKEVQQFLSQIDTPSFKKLAVIEEAKNQNKKALELLKTRQITQAQFAQSEIQIERAKQDKIQEINKNAFSNIASIYKNRDEFNRLKPVEQIVSLSFGVAADITKGFEGALNLTKQFASTVGNTLLPGFGSIIGELTGFLAQSPDKLKEAINSFFTGFPIIIQNIIENIPNLLIGISNGLDQLSDKLPETIDSAIQNFVDRSPEFISALAAQSPMLMTRFSNSLIAQAPSIAQSVTAEFIKNIPLIAVETGKALAKSVTDALGSIGGVLGVGGGGGILGTVGSAVGSVGDFFGFADGGIVPGSAPYVDKIPAMLTPGEEVVSHAGLSRIDKLLNALEQNRSAQPAQNQNLTVNLVIGQDQLASVLLQLNSNGFRTA